MSEPKKLGKYELQSVLGKGAMGVVYKAFDPNIERTVAIKTVRMDLVDPDLMDQFIGRFKNEARAAGRLHHPNIVGVYEYGEVDNVAFIAMEFVEGTGLRAHLDRKTRFDLPHVMSIVSQLLLALDVAHARGVVHRDIKPANVILTPGGQVKVADFGIARIDTTSLTQTGMVMGTPSYMSPEQCQGLATDHRADLFSTGVILYELLTGERPFTGSAEMIAYRICNEAPRPPTQVAPETLPPAVDKLVMTAIAKSPDARFQSAQAFLSALHAVVAGTPGASISAPDATQLNVATGGRELPLAATWNETTLTTVERALTRFVGPVAKILVRNAAAHAHDVTELYALLGANISNSDERRRFVDMAPANDGAGHGTGTGSGPHASGAKATSGGHRPLSTRGTGSAARAPLSTQPLEAPFIDHTTQRLAIYLGPIARVVARKAAEQACTRDEFLQIVAGHIGTQDRRSFLREMDSSGE
ncbi:MAG: serine/threonine-protein kinase [Casimicrobiaceae bacterium]